MSPDDRATISGRISPSQPEIPAARWSMVARAGDRDQPERRRALATLCEAYWYPLYAYSRQRGDSREQAENHTREFVGRFMEQAHFDKADPGIGRFRPFLFSSFKCYLAGEAERPRAQKPGGVAPLPFANSTGEERYARETGHNDTPERAYERRWARALLDRVIGHLRKEFVCHGRLEHFNKLKPCLQSDFEVPYAELARRLETTEATLQAGIYRLRKRYRDRIRLEVAGIVADAADIDAELRHLIAALAGGS